MIFRGQRLCLRFVLPPREAFVAWRDSAQPRADADLTSSPCWVISIGSQFLSPKMAFSMKRPFSGQFNPPQPPALGVP